MELSPHLNLPPLRERMNNVPLLVKSFVEQMQMLTKKEITGLTAEAMHFLMTYRWPGNVRELKAALEYAFVIKDSGLIGPTDLPGYVHENIDVDICHALPNSCHCHVVGHQNLRPRHPLRFVRHLGRGACRPIRFWDIDSDDRGGNCWDYNRLAQSQTIPAGAKWNATRGARISK